ncbi:hypothetical protein E3T24_00790 [Cryobacterium sp. TmT2-59]|uniref:hypothetical protein n=1 Tax=Cryobacterium sp. TmT2-59 TaxID=1259264 RepID=UPI00106C6DF6|nr:hypothetical protein [Cryobacterium sp. TmT2-59]TFC89591.1 hypothetical protein E3T24_00790 [Cryobacterium sp. TmT2-59]
MGRPSGRTSPQASAARPKLDKARGGFMAGSLLMAAFLLLTVLNGLLAGGHMGPGDGERLYRGAIEWPWIPLPAWLVIAVALIAPVSVAMMLRHFTRDDRPLLVYLVMMTLVIYVMLPLLYSTMYRDPTGLPVGVDSYGGFGWHWIGSVFQVVTLSMILIRALLLSLQKPRALEPAEVSL